MSCEARAQLVGSGGKPELKPRSLNFCLELLFAFHRISVFICFPSIHCSLMLLLEAGYSGKPMKGSKMQGSGINLVSKKVAERRGCWAMGSEGHGSGMSRPLFLPL